MTDSPSPSSTTTPSCICEHDWDIHRAATNPSEESGCQDLDCDCPFVPPLPAKEETPTEGEPLVFVCEGCGFISDTTPEHECSAPHKAFLAEMMNKRAMELGISVDELEAKVEAWRGPESASSLSASEITEAIDTMMSAFWKENGARSCPLEMPLYHAARSRLEQLYREQQREIERLRACIDELSEKWASNHVDLSSLKNSQLTPGEIISVIQAIEFSEPIPFQEEIVQKLRSTKGTSEK